MRDLVIETLKEYSIREDWFLYSDKELLDLLMEQIDDVGTRLYWRSRGEDR
jgi:hypothetical protein